MTDTQQVTEDGPDAQAAQPVEKAQEPAVEADGQNDAPLSQEQADELALKVEASLLTTDRPMTSAKLGELLGGFAIKTIQDAADGLNKVYEETGRSFRIEKVAGGLQVLTLPKYADVLSELHKSRTQTRLSPAAMETLAIVAYQQPIMRAQIENIRGVACGEVLRSLMDRHMVKIVGRAEEIGRPMLYGTTKGFLEVFGLSNLKDLPKVEKSKPGGL